MNCGQHGVWSKKQKILVVMMMMKWISTIVCCVSIWSVVVVESRLGQQIMPPMGVMPNMMNNNMGGYGFGQGAQMNSNPYVIQITYTLSHTYDNMFILNTHAQ